MFENLRHGETRGWEIGVTGSQDHGHGDMRLNKRESAIGDAMGT